ncbi:MAG: STAS domain-containing protein [Terriglobales bacterium]
MSMIAMSLKIDEKRVAAVLREAGEKLDAATGDLIVDFSAVRRVDSSTLRAMEEFIRRADAVGVRVVLRAVNVEVYKVLKLMKLTRRFSFEN